MLGEFLARLAIALPLVCAAAVVTLLAVKRGWIRLPDSCSPVPGQNPCPAHSRILP